MKNNKDDKPQSNIGLAAGLGGLGLNLGAAAYLIGRQNRGANKKLQLTEEEADRLYDQLGAGKSRVKVREVSGPYKELGSYYDPSTNSVHSVKTDPIYGHELGHATSKVMPSNRTGRLWGTFYSHGIGMRLSPLARFSTGFHEGYTGKKSNVDKGINYATGGGTALALAEEGQASLRAYNALKKLKGAAYANNVLKKIYIPAYATYAGTAALAHGLAPWAGRQAGKILRND